MKLTFLGTSSGMAVLDRSFSAMLVETQKHTFLVDVGEGTTRQMLRFGFSPESVESVVLSHTHPDHVAGLPTLLQWMHLSGRKLPLSIYVPVGIFPKFETFLSVCHIDRTRWPFRLDILPVSPSVVIEWDGIEIQAIPNGHLAPHCMFQEQIRIGKDAYSFCISENKFQKILVTSDIATLDALENVAQGAEILITECTHISFEEIFEFVRKTGIAKIVLTHIPPNFDSQKANEILSPVAQIHIAKDGEVVEI